MLHGRSRPASATYPKAGPRVQCGASRSTVAVRWGHPHPAGLPVRSGRSKVKHVAPEEWMLKPSPRHPHGPPPPSRVASPVEAGFLAEHRGPTHGPQWGNMTTVDGLRRR